MLAKSMGREIKEISEEDIQKNFDIADENHDGQLTKHEIMIWIKTHLNSSQTTQEETRLMIEKIESEAL